ncbi:MAG: methyltransferase domain-containing protein [Polyangiaceae bacterium]|nr:methyltransferase domain-containing protein [Polyangiaceae bacterium]
MPLGYERVARHYEWLAKLYSLGAIAQTREAHIQDLKEGDKVLYLGIGASREPALATSRGAQVTAVDKSPTMLSLAQGAAAKENVEGHRDLRWVEGDAFEILERSDYRSQFDWIVCPFFLNVFNERSLNRLLPLLTDCLKKHGRLVIADYAHYHGQWPHRVFQWLYYTPPRLLFGLLTGNPWHPLYDYPTLVRQKTSLEHKKTSFFPILRSNLYASYEFSLAQNTTIHPGQASQP